MTYDEYFVRELKLVPEVLSICGTKVFHLEVFQKIPSNSQYPCVVYYLNDDDPEEELAENSKFLTAKYTLVPICFNTEQLRTVAEGIKTYFNNLTKIDALYCDTAGMITWTKANNDSEANVFATEQQEKGKRTTTLTVELDHWQPL